ncbi:MAG: hypothetical protein VX619_05535 [bacterium]|nr:hypothetical protein [bacterium]
MKRISILTIISSLLVPALQATVEYARQEKKACIYCHFSDRGGPRNFLGHYYQKNGYSFGNAIYGDPSYEKQPPVAPDLSFQRPTAEGRIVERQLEILKSIHFRTFSGSSYFAAGQLIKSGQEFARKLDTAGIAYNKNLEEILVREVFGIGRYNVESLALHSKMGLAMKHAPMVHLKARNSKIDPSSYLEKRLELFKKASGYDGSENIAPIYAEYVSGDPHYIEKPDFSAGNGTHWSDDKMNKNIRTEDLGFGIFAKAQLAGNYLKAEHGKGVGVTPRAGYKAQVLIYEMINTMLWLRYGLGFDGAKFRSFPADYYDTKQLLYIPNTLMVEFDEKDGAPTSYYVKERLSHARDLGALLIGLSEFYGMSDPHRLSLRKVFGDGPDDSEEFPFSYNSRHLCKELVQIVLKNLELMHFDRNSGALYSTATLVKPIRKIKTKDVALVMQGLGKAFKYFFDDSEIRNVTGNLIYAIGQYMVRHMQAIDGGLGTSFEIRSMQGDFLNRNLEDQAQMVLAFLEAFKVTREERFYRASTRAYDFMVNKMWDEGLNTFKTSEESDVLKINPMNFGATMGALREMTLATGDLRTFAFMLAYFEGVMKNYSLQLSETDFTGEKIDDVRDSDGDGIIQSDLADGKYGIAPVLASEVQVEPIR